MKVILLISSLFLTASAFATNANSTWGEILNDGTLHANFSNIRADGGYQESRLGFCLTDDNQMLYGGKKTVCTMWKSQNTSDSANCTATKTVELYAPVTSTKEVCVSNMQYPGSGTTCQKYETVSVVEPLTFDVKVVSAGETSFPSAATLFTKKYSYPTCNQ